MRTPHLVLAGLILALATETAFAEPIEWPRALGGNGHFYQAVIILDRVSWEDARDLAESMTHEHVPGYLATPTSQAEQDWITTMLGPVEYLWLGGYQPDGAPEPDGGWQWVTGEEWEFSEWNVGEPNDSAANMDGTENRLQISADQVGGWNDLWPSARVPGFIVEFEAPAVGNEPASLGQIKSSYVGDHQ